MAFAAGIVLFEIAGDSPETIGSKVAGYFFFFLVGLLTSVGLIIAKGRPKTGESILVAQALATPGTNDSVEQTEDTVSYPSSAGPRPKCSLAELGADSERALDAELHVPPIERDGSYRPHSNLPIPPSSGLTRFKETIVAVAVVVGFFALSNRSEEPTRFGERGWEDAVKTTLPCVYHIEGYDADGNLATQGTAFAIDSDGTLITNAHVMTGASRYTATSSTNQEHQVKHVVATDRYRDLAMVVIATETDDHIRVFAEEPPGLGAAIAVIGSPLGLAGTVSEGIVAAIRAGETDPNSSSLIQITAPISPGSSGSPVIDQGGELVGIATMLITDGQNLNFAVSSKEIRAFLAETKNTRKNTDSLASTQADESLPTPRAEETNRGSREGEEREYAGIELKGVDPWTLNDRLDGFAKEFLSQALSDNLNDAALEYTAAIHRIQEGKATDEDIEVFFRNFKLYPALSKRYVTKEELEALNLGTEQRTILPRDKSKRALFWETGFNSYADMDRADIETYWAPALTNAICVEVDDLLKRVANPNNEISCSIHAWSFGVTISTYVFGQDFKLLAESKSKLPGTVGFEAILKSVVDNLRKTEALLKE